MAWNHYWTTTTTTTTNSASTTSSTTSSPTSSTTCSITSSSLHRCCLYLSDSLHHHHIHHNYHLFSGRREQPFVLTAHVSKLNKNKSLWGEIGDEGSFILSAFLSFPTATIPSPFSPHLLVRLSSYSNCPRPSVRESLSYAKCVAFMGILPCYQMRVISKTSVLTSWTPFSLWISKMKFELRIIYNTFVSL